MQSRKSFALGVRKLAFSRFPFRVSRFPLKFWEQNRKLGTGNTKGDSLETVSKPILERAFSPFRLLHYIPRASP
jgi:hypothetical protein